MKTMKRFLAAVLAAVMMFALAATASAAGTVNINNTTIDDQYELYQIFEMDTDKSAGKAQFYKVNDDWNDFTSVSGVSAYYTVDKYGYVLWQKDAAAATGAAFAALALEYLKTHTGLEPSCEDVATVTGGTLTFNGVAEGYYLIVAKDSTGAYKTPGIVAVTGANDPNNITAKDAPVIGLPNIEKTVQENSTNGWGIVNDAAIDETDVVNFKITITTEAAGQGYVLTDTLDAGLTLDQNSIKVFVNGVETGEESATTFDITSKTDSGFKVEFAQALLNTLGKNDTIVVTYSAVLNDSADHGNPGNKNEATLTYTVPEGSSDPGTKSDSTKTYTYQVIVNKVNEDGEALTGAGFTLSKKDEQGSYVEVETLSTGSTFTFTGLDAGDYKLEESTVPGGYKKAADIKFSIVPTYAEGTGELTALTADPGITDLAEGSVTFTVENSTSVLPETGGIGTTIFYTAGGLMVLAAVALLLKKRVVA